MTVQTPEERVAIVVWHLAHGDAFRTSEVCRMTGVSRQGAYNMLCKISRILPVYQSDDGKWQVLSYREAEVAVE